MTTDTKILIYGYGNPGRQDDGLAKALVEKAEEWVLNHKAHHITLDINSQLQVEDVPEIDGQDLVIFVDASIENEVADYLFTPVYADSQVTFSMHAVAPAYLLALYSNMYGQHPPSFMLHIRGYGWDVNRPVTQAATDNLKTAWNALREVLMNPWEMLEIEDPLHCGI